MRVAAALLVVAGCRSQSGSGTTAQVQVYAGDRPAPGVTVLAHSATGEITAASDTDAVGLATIGIEDDSLLTFELADHALTTMPPSGDATLEVHDRPPEPPALVVGVLGLDGPPLPGAVAYEVDVGCVTLVVPLPDSIDIGACSQGNDRFLDVLVTAHDAATVIGHAAGRVPIVSGIADFEISWQTPTPLPIALDVPATLDITYLADGNPYPATAAGLVFAGLDVERTRIAATLGQRTTTRHVAGVPSSIGFGADDFLAPVTAAFGHGIGDALVLRTADRQWQVVLPPDAASFTPPEGYTDPLVSYEYVDSDELAGFDALRAAGVYVTTIVPAPAAGDVRTTASE